MQTTSNRIISCGSALLVGATLVGAVAVGGWLWSVLGSGVDALHRGVPLSADEALLGLVAAVGLATVVWLTLGVVLEAAARVPGQVGRVAARASAVVSPVVVRRAVGVLLGATLGASLAPGVSMASTGAALSAAVGVSTSPGPGPASPVPDAVAPDPAFAPPPDPGFGPTHQQAPRAPTEPGTPTTAPGERFVATPPVVRPQPDVSALAAADRRAPGGTDHEVVVQRGDSLWSIAARHLGRAPSDAEIAEEWPRWYDANRSVIGPDPDRILPGQVLVAPAGVGS